MTQSVAKTCRLKIQVICYLVLKQCEKQDLYSFRIKLNLGDFVVLC
jgi:hypothetical protein